MKGLTPSQEAIINEFTDNPYAAAPLVLAGKDSELKADIIEDICRKCGFTATDSAELAQALIERMRTAGQSNGGLSEMLRTAIVIKDMDFFKDKPILQSELLWLMLKSDSPIVLGMTSYEDFTWDMRKFIGEGNLISR